jgi:hypothetical protein
VKEPYVIVWDLDGTVGDFSALHQQGETSNPIVVKVRPEMAETLQALNKAGFIHTLLTRASPLYAEIALRGTGLRPFFALVEGVGQRGKGDAAGIAQVLHIPEKELPHRMFFVGDLPVFDEPQDPRVLFHLEPCCMDRSARELERLVLHLREVGNGSLREGFDLLGNPIRWWQWIVPLSPRMPVNKPIRCSLPDIGQLILMIRHDGCPIILFEHAPPPGTVASDHTLIPAEFVAQIQAEAAKGLPELNSDP